MYFNAISGIKALTKQEGPNICWDADKMNQI